MEKRLKELMHQAVVMESSFDVIDGIHIYDEVERLEKIEDRLLAQWAYAKASGNDADAQHVADLLGYEPDPDSVTLKPAPKFNIGDTVEAWGVGKFDVFKRRIMDGEWEYQGTGWGRDWCYEEDLVLIKAVG